MSVASGTIATSIDGAIMTFTDTGTYGTVTSRTLVIKDFNGNVVATYDMGSSLTQTQSITADGYFEFDLTVVDNTGTYTATIDYVSAGYYLAAYLARFNNSDCGCDPKGYYMDQAEDSYRASIRFNLAGNPIAAQTCITDANTLINIY